MKSETEAVLERIKMNEKYQDKFRGSLVGGAAGDALGYPVEFYSLRDIQEKYGKAGIMHYQYGQDGYALISDDTQMTLFTATGILVGKTRVNMRGIGGYYPDYIWRSYQTWYEMQTGRNVSGREQPFSWLHDVPEMGENRAPGNTCMSALGSGNSGSVEQPLNNSKGCGGIMRVAPIGLYMNRCMENMPDQMKELDLIAAETASITHGHPLGYMPAAAFAHIINRIVYWNMSVEGAVRDAISAMREVFKNQEHLEEMVVLMEKAIQLANNDMADAENIRKLGEGWVAEETLAISIYCSVKYADNFSKAIIAAVNHDGDSDSTGAVTGNIVGAVVGYESIPNEWKDHLECLDVILEVSDDLCRDCQMQEYGSYRDPEWEAKYIYMKASRKEYKG